MTADIGIIGGSGLYQIETLKTIDEFYPDTPFGKPSDQLLLCEYKGRKAAFLPRHGKHHGILPTEVPSKANIYAMKMLGIKHILSFSAVGSLQERYAPTHFVIPDQLIDRTRSRPNTYFGEGIVGHVAFAEPFCSGLAEQVARYMKQQAFTTHVGGTAVCMEGPLFSTKAESHLYRSWNADIIGMTSLPEAKLAREAEISYVMIAMVTDYDCWHESEESVTVEMVMKTMKTNTDNVKTFLPELITSLDLDTAYPSHMATQFAIMTPPEFIPEKRKQELELFYGKYWKR